jgi:hypothetical protein
MTAKWLSRAYALAHTAAPQPRSPATISAFLRADLIDSLQQADPRDWPSCVANACIDLGGSLISPQHSHGGWGPFQHEISLLGVMGMGENFGEAVSDWMKCASRTLDAKGGA